MSDLEDFENAMRSSLEAFVAKKDSSDKQKKSSKPLQSLPRVARSSKKPSPAGSQITDSPAPKTGQTKKSGKPWSPTEQACHQIKLRVRRKQLAADEFFDFRSSKLSRVEAEIDARNAAHEAGYPIIAFVEEWQTL